MIEQKATLLLYGEGLHLGCRYAEALHTSGYADDTSQRRPPHSDAECLADNGDSKKRDAHSCIKQEICNLLFDRVRFH